MKLKVRSTLLSLGICAIINVAVLGYFSLMPVSIGWFFIGGLVIHFGLIALALLLMAFRFSGFCAREGFWYVFAGIANLWVGVWSVALFGTGFVNGSMPETFIINLVLGTIMLADGLLLPRKPWEKAKG